MSLLPQNRCYRYVTVWGFYVGGQDTKSCPIACDLGQSGGRMATSLLTGNYSSPEALKLLPSSLQWDQPGKDNPLISTYPASLSAWP